MSDEQKYSELLKEIGQSIKEKNDTICILNIKIRNLERDLEELRKEKTDE